MSWVSPVRTIMVTGGNEVEVLRDKQGRKISCMVLLNANADGSMTIALKPIYRERFCKSRKWARRRNKWKVSS